MRYGIPLMAAAGGILAASLTATPASALPARAGAATSANISGRPGQADVAGQAGAGQAGAGQAGAGQAGAVTGVVRGPDGAPLTGACVETSGPAGIRFAMTGPGGRYVLSGLRPGRYTVSYHVCRAGDSRLRQWSAAAGPPGPATRLLVSSGLTTLPPVTLATTALAAGGAAGRGAAVRWPAPPGSRRLTLAQVRALNPSGGFGGLAGRVTDKAGHPLKNICVRILFRNGWYGITTARNGTWNTGRSIPAGHRHDVEFTPSCDPFGPVTKNWAPEWYRNVFRASAATPILVRARKTLRGINAVMRRGAQITGTVATRAGKGLSGVCVVLFSGNQPWPVDGFATFPQTRRGRYRIMGLDPGSYRLLFDSSCVQRTRAYLSQWWRDAPTIAKSTPIHVKLGKTASNVSARLRLGGQITGQVRLRDSSGQPLAGICVIAYQVGAFGALSAQAATRANGSYTLVGLPTGSYGLQFMTGCTNDGNYVMENYPHALRVTAGRTVGHVNAYLQPGGILSGTVTDSHGTPLAHICVGINDSLGDYTMTGLSGTYLIDQLPAGHPTIEFSAGCGSRGSYAPQWYRDQTNPSGADPVTIAPDQTTAGVNATMQPGAVISGQVTSPAGHKINGACALAMPPGTTDLGGAAGYAITRNGSYRITNLASGPYQIEFLGDCFGLGNWSTTWFQSQAGQRTADQINATAGTPVTGVDAVLRRGGRITGSIRTASGLTTFGICVTATNRGTGTATTTLAGAVGAPNASYAIAGLTPGTYTVEFADCFGDGLASQWYNGSARPGSATPVWVVADHATGHVDALLQAGGTIAGQVTAAGTGVHARGVCVTAGSGPYQGYAISDARGRYRITGLNTASYRLSYQPCAGRANLASQFRAGRVSVAQGHAVTGVNMTLARGGAISGLVEGGLPATRQPGVCVDAVPVSAGGIGGSATAGRDGRYVIRHLAAGQYKVYFGDPSCPHAPPYLAPQWFDNQPTRGQATPVTVAAGRTTPGVSATLLPDGAISGTVTGPSPALTPLTGICVRAVPASSSVAVVAVTGNGSYQITGLIPGRYRMEFFTGCGATGYATQWWQNASSEGQATVVTVSANATTPSINATMQP